jgi:hypothetical protein
VDATPDARIAVLAATRLGLVTLAQAKAAGLTPRAIAHRVRSGRWDRVRPGVYRIAGSDPTAAQALLAACLHQGLAAVASHRSAAWLWGLDGFDEPPVRPEVIVVGDATRRDVRTTLHRTTVWTLSDRSVCGVTPVTSPTRTLVDLGAVVPRHRVEAARDSAHRLGLVSLARERRQLERLAALPGAGVLRRLVADDRGMPPAQSLLKRTVLRRLRALGVPEPVRQHEIRVERRPIRFDAAWPDVRVAIEAHSYRHHSDRRHWSDDVTRLNAAGRCGWLVIVATQEGLADGGRRLAVEVEGALRSRRAHPA